MTNNEENSERNQCEVVASVNGRKISKLGQTISKNTRHGSCASWPKTGGKTAAKTGDLGTPLAETAD